MAVNSNETAARVRTYYGHEPTVIHPPVAVEFFGAAAGRRRAEYLLAVSRFVPYKRLDIAIDAAALGGRPLVVAGAGPLSRPASPRRSRPSDGVEFRVSPSDEEVLREPVRRCRRRRVPRLGGLRHRARRGTGGGHAGGRAGPGWHGGHGARRCDRGPRGEQIAPAFVAAIQRLLADPPARGRRRANAVALRGPRVRPAVPGGMDGEATAGGCCPARRARCSPRERSRGVPVRSIAPRYRRGGSAFGPIQQKR